MKTRCSKRCPQSEGRGFLQYGHFSDKGEGFLIWCKNHCCFQKLWCVRTNNGREGSSQREQFSDKERVNFSRFCEDVFYERSRKSFNI